MKKSIETKEEKTFILIDCDHTIFEQDIVDTMMKTTLNKKDYDYIDKFQYDNGYDILFSMYYKTVKKQNKTINDLKNALQIPQLVEGMKDFFSYIKENKKKFLMVVISGDDSYTIKYALEYNNLINLFDGFLCIPSHESPPNSDELVTIEPLPKNNCNDCDPSLCKTNELRKYIKLHPEAKNYRKCYICDGYNDFCLTMGELVKGDILMVRKNYSLDKYLAEEKCYEKLSKKGVLFYRWENGKEIVKFLKEKNI